VERSSGLAVIPAYNEEATLADVVRGVQEHQPELDILVVDDGSTDATGDVGRIAGAQVMRLPFNLGVGGAVQAGFLHAVERGYQSVVQVDADGQHDPAEIARLREEHDRGEAVDVVCGSRFLDENRRYPAPVSRRTGIHLFAFIVSRIVGQRISDPTSGFRLYNRPAIELLARNYPHDYPEVEAVLLLHYHRLRLREVPVRMYQRGGGRSSIEGSGKSFYYLLKVLLAIFVGLLRARPVVEPGDEAPVAAAPGVR
jgi:glycosyltransferase involved in cell wall biosynthesis